MDPLFAPVVPEATFADQVKDGLMASLASGVLERGQVYPIAALAEQMGVSRTPVREALLQLQHAGLVRILPSQGVLILDRTAEELRQVFEIRLLLEVPAVRDVARRVTPDDLARLEAAYARLVAVAEQGDRFGVESHDRAFHQRLLELSGNERLAAVVDGLRDELVSSGHAGTGRSHSVLLVAREHEPILEAVRAGDPDAAAAAMTTHLTVARDRTIAEATMSHLRSGPAATT